MTTQEGDVGILASILHGSGLYIIAQFISRLFGFLFRFILTNYLGAAGFGVLAYSLRIGRLVAKFSVFGSDEALLRFIPENPDNMEYRNRAVIIAYLTTATGSVILGAILYNSAPLINNLTLDSQLFTKSLQVFSLFIPIQAFIATTSHVFRGLGKIKFQLLTKDIGQRSAHLLGAVCSVFLGLTVVGVSATIVVLLSIVAVAGLFAVFRYSNISRPNKVITEDYKKFYRVSFPITLTAVGGVLTGSIDVLMVGYFIDSSAVGIYDTAYALAAIISLPLLSTNQLFSPIASELYHSGEIKRLRNIYATITKINLIATIPASVAFVLYRRDILNVFGESFVAGGSILALLTFGQLVNSSVGPSGHILLISGRQDFLAINEWVLGISNTLLNLLLINVYGAVGAAIATATSLTVMNLVRLGEVWYLEGLSPYSTDFSALIFPTILSSLVMISLQYIFSDTILVVIGGGSGVIVFILVYVFTGITKEEKELYHFARSKLQD